MFLYKNLARWEAGFFFTKMENGEWRTENGERNSVAVYQLLKSSKENFMPTPLNLGKVKPVKMPMLTARVVQP